MMLGSDPIYDGLVQRFVPRFIRNDDDYRQALEIVEELLAKDSLHPSESEYLEFLAPIIDAYESGRFPIDDIYGVEFLKVMMQERGLKQKDLIDVFNTASVVSEVLSGKRELTKSHIERLSHKFAVSPANFFPTVKTEVA
jgi:HTH-type transcriptional regulator/antitoxin HigA